MLPSHSNVLASPNNILCNFQRISEQAMEICGNKCCDEQIFYRHEQIIVFNSSFCSIPNFGLVIITLMKCKSTYIFAGRVSGVFIRE